MPPDDNILDPRGAFSWVEAGVSGLARQREWDATAIAEVPSLQSSDVGELDFRVLGDGSVIGDVDPAVVADLTRELSIDAPYIARAVRQDGTNWIVGAVQMESELVELATGAEALSLEAAVPPEGEPMYLVDGEIQAELPDGPAGEALAELERIGAERFQAFVARADRLEDGRWELTVDPL
ncbi:MAG TPA: hypothetical protein VD769_14525 [Gaiellaceae bacterium]|nr:hypothetical protein [Gaiellaceae bacterium]